MIYRKGGTQGESKKFFFSLNLFFLYYRYVQASDKQTIKRLTNLSDKQLESLLEEDELLLLENIPQNNHPILSISFPLFCTIEILRLTKNKKFDPDDKLYVADALANTYPRLHTTSFYSIDGNQSAKFYLVLIGVFPECITKRKTTPKLSYYIALTSQLLEYSGQVSIKNSLDEWLCILDNLKNSWNIGPIFPKLNCL